MIGRLTTAEIEQVLRTGQVGRLGVYGDGRIYIFPVNYGYDGASIFVHSHEGLKVQLMRAHPEVCVEVEEIDSSAHWRSVMAHGEFEELTDEARRDAALAAIAGQGERLSPPSVAPYVDGPAKLVVYRIQVTERTGRYEQNYVLASHSV